MLTNVNFELDNVTGCVHVNVMRRRENGEDAPPALRFQVILNQPGIGTIHFQCGALQLQELSDRLADMIR